MGCRYSLTCRNVLNGDPNYSLTCRKELFLNGVTTPTLAAFHYFAFACLMLSRIFKILT